MNIKKQYILLTLFEILAPGTIVLKFATARDYRRFDVKPISRASMEMALDIRAFVHVLLGIGRIPVESWLIRINSPGILLYDG